MGKTHGFVKRKGSKISPYNFVLGFILCCCKKCNTYSEWAAQIGLLTGSKVKKQSIFDRLHERTVKFAKELLVAFLVDQSLKRVDRNLFTAFNKVLLQDSTTLSLPPALVKVFPGNTSRGKQKAVARIGCTMDLKTMQFAHFDLHPYTQNDQSQSSSILSHAKKGDLVIRDLGYFAIATFNQLIGEGVYFLSRLKYGVKLYDDGGNEIKLKTLLKRGKPVDRWVYIGNKKQLRVRLVMIPVPAVQAAHRKRKARNDRDRRLNHSREYYQWLGYSVFITTVPKAIWTTTQIAQIYRVRWHIEIIFKSWKSGFYLQALLHKGCTNAYRVKVSIYLLLLFMALFMQKIYMRYKEGIERKTANRISLLKLMGFISRNVLEIFTCSFPIIKELIALHCCYDKRSDRINMTDLLYTF